jgi:hypothetical protein
MLLVVIQNHSEQLDDGCCLGTHFEYLSLLCQMGFIHDRFSLLADGFVLIGSAL